MRLKWKIGLLAGAAVLALGGGTIISATQDADWLKTRLADAVESSTGRHLSIGQLHVWILPFPWVEAKDVKLSSVAEDGVNMLDIGQVRARLALLPLFSHRIAFEDVSLISPQVQLRRLADGRADWHFTPQERQSSIGGSSSASSGKMHWNLTVSDLSLTQAQVAWDDAVHHRSGAFQVAEGKVKGLSGNAPDFDVKLRKGAGQLALTGQTGPLLPMSAQLPMQLRISLTVNGHPAGLAHIDGSITDPQGQKVYALQIGGSVAQLRDLNVFFPHANLPEGRNVSVDMAVGGQGAQPAPQSLHVRAENVDVGAWLPQAALTRVVIDTAAPTDPVTAQIDGQVGAQVLSLRGTVGTMQQLAASEHVAQQIVPVDLTLTQGESSIHGTGTLSAGASALDVHGQLAHVVPGGDLPAANDLKVDGHIDVADTASVVRHHAVPDVLRGARGAMDVQAQSVNWQGVTWAHVSTHATLQNSRLTLEPVQAEGNGFQQVGRLVYDVAGALPQIELAAHPVFLPLPVVERWLGLSSSLSGTVQLVGAVSTQGETSEDRRNNLDGHLGVSVVDGSISGAAIRTLLGPQVPVKGKMPVRCFGSHMQFAQGNANIDMLGLETPFLVLHGHGTVGLGSQALDMHLSPRVLLGGASASSDVAVTGTLSDPKPRMDPAYEGRYGISIGGNDGEGDNCPSMLSAAREGVAGPDAPQKKAGKEGKVMNMLRGLGLFQ
ncbi:hypothetical protein SRCM100623_00114 [Acetobacter pasteurianus]|uniref:AsmA domain-containing protein n=1 Tax=Acetobacter pasteurianus TaxID=438 RepID=A0A1A0DNQ7_ACEPA|nr:AsmA family protein [Acetobacter pasteurianus]OAZ76888.1 hypothetical protein SRCM100623_00114 [Acetobacter pasteurianus]